jgi:hypothetical protein
VFGRFVKIPFWAGFVLGAVVTLVLVAVFS